MRINTKFPVAIHALTLIAMNQREEQPNTSELIAKSVGTNPVVIRRLLPLLKKNGLIHTQAGIAGATLAKAPSEIRLLDIYQAVNDKEERGVFDLHQNPSPYCPIGRHILKAVEEPLNSAEQALKDTLSSYTLADIIRSVHRDITVE